MTMLHKPETGTDSQKDFLLSLLRESREKFLGSFARVSEQQSRMRPGSDRWSILETVEHLTAAETLMVKLVTTQRVPRSAGAEELCALPAGARRHRHNRNAEIE